MPSQAVVEGTEEPCRGGEGKKRHPRLANNGQRHAEGTQAAASRGERFPSRPAAPFCLLPSRFPFVLSPGSLPLPSCPLPPSPRCFWCHLPGFYGKLADGARNQAGSQVPETETKFSPPARGSLAGGGWLCFAQEGPERRSPSERAVLSTWPGKGGGRWLPQ